MQASKYESIDGYVTNERPAWRHRPWQPDHTTPGEIVVERKQPVIDIHARDPYWRRFVRMGEDDTES